MSVVCSAVGPASRMSTTGINRMKTQKESVFEKRPQLKPLLLLFLLPFFGDIGTGIYSRLAMYGICRKLSA